MFDASQLPDKLFGAFGEIDELFGADADALLDRRRHHRGKNLAEGTDIIAANPSCEEHERGINQGVFVDDARDLFQLEQAFRFIRGVTGCGVGIGLLDINTKPDCGFVASAERDLYAASDFYRPKRIRKKIIKLGIYAGLECNADNAAAGPGPVLTGQGRIGLHIGKQTVRFVSAHSMTRQITRCPKRKSLRPFAAGPCRI